MQKTINISGVLDVKEYLDIFMTTANEYGLPLKNLEIDGNELTFTFGHWGDIGTQLKVKKYSKLKYFKGAWRSEHDKANQWKSRWTWNERYIIETEENWIVISSKDFRRD